MPTLAPKGNRRSDDAFRLFHAFVRAELTINRGDQSGMKRNLIVLSLVSALLYSAVAASGSASAYSTVRVTGNTVDTSLGANGSLGWWFNRDSASPYQFSLDKAKIGAGSLHVLPIVSETGTLPNLGVQKFVGENFVKTAITADTAISFDYFRGTSPANQFYLNVYVNSLNDNKFYDCRYDFVGTGGNMTDWATISSTATPVNVQKSGTGRIATCPATLAGAAGFFIRMFAVNVGDSSNADVGVSGYLDNVVFTTGAGTTVYDLDVTPADKDACKKGGYALYGFANQGQCIASLQAHAHTEHSDGEHSEAEHPHANK